MNEVHAAMRYQEAEARLIAARRRLILASLALTSAQNEQRDAESAYDASLREMQLLHQQEYQPPQKEGTHLVSRP